MGFKKNWALPFALAISGTLPSAAENGINGPELSLRAFYESWESNKSRIETDILSKFGKRFVDLSGREYREFVAALDLSTSNGLMHWSVAAGIPVVAVKKGSNFFYFNAHLLPNSEAEITYERLSRLKAKFDVETQQLRLLDGKGRQLRTRRLDAGVIQRLGKTQGWIHPAGFVAAGVSYSTLEPYLAHLTAVPHRVAIAKAIARLPAGFVKALHGKGIYLSLEKGRSYAASQPLSNDVYALFAGFVPGVFLETNTERQTPRTLIHELCHLLDHTVIENAYGKMYHALQFPEFQKLRSEKEKIFGARGGDVPQTPYGYISTYAKTNAQEDFAEHCMAYIWEPGKFKEKAEQEQRAGHAELLRKFEFIARTLEKTPPVQQQLSTEFIVSRPNEPPTSPDCRSGLSRDLCCRSRLTDISNIKGTIAAFLEIPVQCEVSGRRRIEIQDGDYYYAGVARCRTEQQPTAAAPRRLMKELRVTGYSGFGYMASNKQAIIIGSVSTQPCSVYE